MNEYFNLPDSGVQPFTRARAEEVRDFFQQIQDGFDKLPPAAELGFTKGDPGGNIMSAGLASQIASMNIGSGTKVIGTSGSGLDGIGRAWFREVDVSVSTFPPAGKGIWWDNRLGSTARWLLDPQQELNVSMFGAAGNGTTDDAAVFEMARDYGVLFRNPRMLLPSGAYRWSRRLAFKNPIHWYSVAGVNFDAQYSDVAAAYGPVAIAVDAGVAGMLFYADSDAATPSAYTGRKWQGANGSRLDGISIISRSGGSTYVSGAIGIEARCKVDFRNGRCVGFGDVGMRVHATSDINNDTNGLADPYGNANGSRIVNWKCLGNAGAGFENYGRDANDVQYLSCEAQANGSWGVDMQCTLGSRWAGDISTNNRLSRAGSDPFLGSIRSRGQVAANVYDVYIEPGGGALHDLQSPDTMIGQQGGAGVGNSPTTRAFVMAGGKAIGAPYRHESARNASSLTVIAQMGGEVGFGPFAHAFGSQYDSSTDLGAVPAYRVALNPTSRWWSMFGTAAADYIQLPPVPAAQVAGYIPRFPAPSFPNGLLFGGSGNGIHIDQSAGKPDDTVGANGDFQFTTNPSVSAGKILIGWSKVAGSWTDVYGTTS